MLRAITQKCPSCGYVFVEKQHIEVQTVSVEKRYTHRPVRNLNPIHGKEIIKEMYPKIECNTSAYMRNQIFLEKVSEDNRWVELYNKISNEQNTK